MVSKNELDGFWLLYASNVHLHATGTIKETILPLILKMCDRSQREQDVTLTFLAQHFGKICRNLSSCIFGNEKVPLISHYQQMSRLGVNAYKRVDEQNFDGSPVS